MKNTKKIGAGFIKCPVGLNISFQDELKAAVSARSRKRESGQYFDSDDLSEAEDGKIGKPFNRHKGCFFFVVVAFELLFSLCICLISRTSQ